MLSGFELAYTFYVKYNFAISKAIAYVKKLWYKWVWNILSYTKWFLSCSLTSYSNIVAVSLLQEYMQK